MTISYSNINTTESVGSSVNTALKGAFQFTAATIDKGLDTSMGATDLIVAFLMVGLAIGLLGYFARGKRIVSDAM